MSKMLERYQRFKNGGITDKSISVFEIEKMFNSCDYESMKIPQKNRIKLILNRLYKYEDKCVA